MVGESFFLSLKFVHLCHPSRYQLGRKERYWLGEVETAYPMESEPALASCRTGLAPSLLQDEPNARYSVLIKFLKHFVLQKLFSFTYLGGVETGGEDFFFVSLNLVI